MAFTCRYFDSSYHDITDYYLGPNDVPLYKSNDNFAPVIHFFTAEISFSCPETFVLGNTIQILGPSIGQTFVIKKISKNYQTRKTYLYCEHRLCKLKDYYITKTNLDTAIKTTANEAYYKFRDNRYDSMPTYDYSNMSLLWVIEKMFVDAGVTGYVFSDAGDVAINIGGTDYNFEHIVLDYAMFWTINQNATKDLDPNYNITYWDFIQAVCSFWGFTFFEDKNQIIMKAMGTLTTVVPADSYLADYIETESVNKGETALTDIWWTGLIHEYYESSTNYNIDANLNTDTVNPTTFQWYNNLRFLMRSLAIGAGAGDVTGAYVDFITNASGLTNNFIKVSIENDYVEKEYLFFDQSILSDEYYGNEVILNVAESSLKVIYKDFS